MNTPSRFKKDYYGGGLMTLIGLATVVAGLQYHTGTLAAILALAMCAIATVVFWWALQLQLPLFAWGV
ncbi:hypothetical protein OR16_41104 [Cupriavidus basilensis OR16]|uniref:Uncharacterized protein n=1 Tax=Cupriavidus basilensis OR16 TaxID=1127483 RepID=H1SIA2_9BURK|nr:hypothetical protein [Cupriavidus basilensis]EHP37753.1 hypothetical protein OR16_41104 [Cupriavidus basilensis OR16]